MYKIYKHTNVENRIFIQKKLNKNIEKEAEKEILEEKRMEL